MKGYAANAQFMTDVGAVIEQARREGRDLATALRIARVTLAYVSGPNPDPEQARAIEAFDRHLSALPAEMTAGAAPGRGSDDVPRSDAAGVGFKPMSG